MHDSTPLNDAEQEQQLKHVGAYEQEAQAPRVTAENQSDDMLGEEAVTANSDDAAIKTSNTSKYSAASDAASASAPASAPEDASTSAASVSSTSPKAFADDDGPLGPDPNDPEDYAAFQAFLAECGTCGCDDDYDYDADEEVVADTSSTASTSSTKGSHAAADNSAADSQDIAATPSAASLTSASEQQQQQPPKQDQVGSAFAAATGAAAAAAAAASASATTESSSNAGAGAANANANANEANGAQGSTGETAQKMRWWQRRVKRRKHEFWRSLQFRIMVIFAIAGLIATATMGVMSYLKIYKTTQEFVDEELSQISLVAINYRMIIPRRWEAPRHNHERVIRLRNRDGRIIVEYGTIDRDGTAQGQGQSQSQGQGQGMGPSRGMGPSQSMGMGMGRGMGLGAGAGAGAAGDPELTPSIFDIHKFNYDIIIAPLYGRPGDALYIPPGVPDGFYTVLVADQRVRAFISTNTVGQRFVVARPLSSMESITKQALISSIWQFIGINLVFIPLLMISVKLMFVTLNKIARTLYKRTEDDLSPVIPENHVGFVPSELDGFIIALNRLFSRVDEGIQSKRRFIADAAHEMRTPLTALSLQAESLELEELSPSARRKVERLKEGISRERQLMTALLTLAREQNRSDLTLETIDVMQVFTKLIDEQGLLADRKGIDLGVEGNAQYSIISDRMRLMRVMSNLVSNAIKYTDDNGRIDLMAEPVAGGGIKLIVKDDGPGIPEEHIKHILEPFYRVNGDRSAVQGTGLGLAIVKASCDSLKADLNFKNAKPHGLIASVTLRPLELPPAANKDQDKGDGTATASAAATDKQSA